MNMKRGMQKWIGVRRKRSLSKNQRDENSLLIRKEGKKRKKRGVHKTSILSPNKQHTVISVTLCKRFLGPMMTLSEQQVVFYVIRTRQTQ